MPLAGHMPGAAGLVFILRLLRVGHLESGSSKARVRRGAWFGHSGAPTLARLARSGALTKKLAHSATFSARVSPPHGMGP